MDGYKYSKRRESLENIAQCLGGGDVKKELNRGESPSKPRPV